MSSQFTRSACTQGAVYVFINIDRVLPPKLSASIIGKQKSCSLIHAIRVYSRFDHNLIHQKPVVALPPSHFFFFLSLTSIRAPPSPPLKLSFPSNRRSEFHETTAIIHQIQSSTNPTKNHSDLLLYFRAPTPLHCHFSADFRPTAATSRDSDTTIVLLLEKATNHTKNISQSSPENFVGISNHCRIHRVFAVNCFSRDIEQSLKLGEAPGCCQGKAPTRNQSDAPDIPRFRDAKAVENYTKSFPRKVASTKFLCKPTLISLGVLEGVTQLFRNIGWENLLNLMAHTYELPTREFLADSGYDSEKKKATFQLLGDQRYIDFATINDILVLTSSNTSTIFEVLPAEFNHETFWMEITGVSSRVPIGIKQPLSIGV
ncbi:unnamed protein product [Lactuca saligna]|uniref:Arabidopsis retrotransposon Orf1 C-terminal domain-containing protein n=1 Tax=Lactuca saligna TaxID=75948 RepID=A0AA35VQ49_LACSI|nr:unnamed protein product [Lactuca saligna]